MRIVGRCRGFPDTNRHWRTTAVTPVKAQERMVDEVTPSPTTGLRFRVSKGVADDPLFRRLYGIALLVMTTRTERTANRQFDSRQFGPRQNGSITALALRL